MGIICSINIYGRINVILRTRIITWCFIGRIISSEILERTSDFRNIINDEEYYVEEFGNAMATNGDGMFSSIGDFLDDYNEQILAIRNQAGGSKWLQHFS